MEDQATQQITGLDSLASQRQHKALFWGVTVCSIFAIFWGFFIFNNRIYSYAESLLSLGTSTVTSEEDLERLQALSALQYQDTDGDGLNDFQERFETNTSEYLADTDGDGVNDYDEFVDGTDPNCAEGNECGVRVVTGTSTGVDLTATPEEIETFLALEDLSAEQLREEMVKIGIPQDAVDQATDQELQSVYEAVREQYVAATGTTSATSAPTDPNSDITLESVTEGQLTNEDLLFDETESQGVLSSVTSAQDLANLNADQVRQLLTEGGVSAAELELLSDDEILSLYQQALSEQQSQ